MRKRGRPKITQSEESAVLSVRVASSLYDRLYQAASAERLTLAEYARRELSRPFCIRKSENAVH